MQNSPVENVQFIEKCEKCERNMSFELLFAGLSEIFPVYYCENCLTFLNCVEKLECVFDGAEAGYGQSEGSD